MRYPSGGRTLERLAGGARGGATADSRPPARWRTRPDRRGDWSRNGQAADIPWLRGRRAALAREALQQGLLFPVTRAVARPRVLGAELLESAPQPAVIAANHASDVDTPLVLSSLPRAWRTRTLVGAASDRFYRSPFYALMTALWINTFPFDRSRDLRGIADSAELLREGWNVLLYPQATRSHGVERFRAGVARLCIASRVPLVPVHLAGTALVMPKGRGLTQRGSTTVAFGRPLYPHEGEQPGDLLERLSEAVGALAVRARRAR